MPVGLNTNEPGEELIKVIPHEVQKEFIQIPDSIYEGLYGGAAYGGKTFILVMIPLIRGWYKFRGWKGLLLRRELTDLEKEVVRLSKEYFIHTGGKYNETKHSWSWPEYGSYFDFSHIQHLKDVKAYDSAQYNYAAFDELTHFEEPMYRYFVGSRVRPGSNFNIAIVRNGTNPGGIGHTFVYNRFVRPCESGYKIIFDERTKTKRIFIPAKIQDNPYGMQYDPEYGNKLEILPEAEKKAKKYGDWHSFEGSVFTTFRPIKFPDEPANALHTCPHFEIPEWWPRILTVDWGKRALCHAMWSAISPEDRLYVYRERTWRGVDVPFWATEIGQVSEFENIVVFVLCGSGWQEHGNTTIARQVRDYSGMTPVSSENTPNSRVSTLQLVHDFMRWEQKPYKEPTELYDHGRAQEIYRKFGEIALRRYTEQYKAYEAETNIPKLQILLKPGNNVDTVAPILVETIPICVYDENKKEDIKEFDGDDPIDNLRYTCKFAHRYMNGQIGEELERRKVTQNIIEQYQTSHDTNKFYRQMEYVEAMAKQESFGVKRHRSRRR
jgi:hypothetical protein